MACLLGYGEVGLWLKKQRVMANSWAVPHDNLVNRRVWWRSLSDRCENWTRYGILFYRVDNISRDN